MTLKQVKILYAIQGTGNGHLARARDIYPELEKYGSTDVLISGIQADLDLPFPVKYRLHGLSFIFGKHGGVDRWATLKRLRLIRLLYDIFHLDVREYDLVISDFEPVSSWACKLYRKPCIALSHQSAVLHPKAPKPLNRDWFGQLVLKHYAPHHMAYGFHFRAIDQQVFTPVIRKEVRQLTVTEGKHITVYLPSYDDNILVKELSAFPGVEWQVFSKHCKEAFSFKDIHIRPIENNAFMNSMASSAAVLCGAGFETPAEALFLGKKLLAIPMHGQLEQQYNAAFLSSLGVLCIPGLHKKYRAQIREWISNTTPVCVQYPDNTRNVVARVMEDFLLGQLSVLPVASQQVSA